MNKNRKIALICVCIICVMLLCSCGGRQKIDTIYAEERGGCELKISSNKGGVNGNYTTFYRQESINELKTILEENNPENQYEIYGDSIVIFTKENGAFIINSIVGDKYYNYVFESIVYPYYLFNGEKMNIVDINGKSFALKYEFEKVISFYQKAGFKVDINKETDTTKEIDICDMLEYINPVGVKYMPQVEKYTILYDNSSETVNFKFNL